MEELKFEINNEYEVSNVHEIDFDWNGFNFLVIYGKHVSGWFIAIPNHGICVQATEPDNDIYNIQKLSDAFNNVQKGLAIAKAVKEHWKEVKGNDRADSNNVD